MTSFKQLEAKIQAAYTEGVTVDEAEKLAGEFLHAMLQVSEQLKAADLDSRMRKTGVKAVRAAIYMQEATKDSKKPTEAMLSALVDSHEVVQSEQNSYDLSEANHDELERMYNIFKEAHIFYRGISRGKFE